MLATPRRPVFVVSCILALIFGLPTLRAQGPTQIRVLSFNINHGEGTDSRVDLTRITEAIREAEPDVVALQEVDRGMARTGRLDQARLLAGRLGLEHAFGGNLEIFGGEFGNAVLSRFPIAGAENHTLPSSGGGEPRGALEVTIAPERGPSFRLISTQLDHRQDDRDRLAAADRLVALADAEGAPPAVLAGDLNAAPGSGPLDVLESRWTPTSQRPLPTVPADAPRAAVDQILVAPEGRWRVVEVSVVGEPSASDHRPVLAVLELLPESTP
ncbi:endonuclease/exonuclease/phosphatase family protein [Tautonia sociabilis]|uniref:Endonuclease n=1 Tax=Tautonia sociabilis TaxID=2080755 RepID=A0A432MPM5_9BACT|nr:endonuclease/exonuclease/phosphatase family protein [Tautonia sociabilis]RUL89290.1 endonuclease [Tautonia sociabilis]